jgi:next-to-BRCA1 protein 1
VQVEQPSGGKQAAAINLNQLPEANTTKPFLFNINSAQAFLSGWRGRLQCETVEPKEPEPVPSDMSSAPAAVEPVQIPVTDAPASSAEAAPAAVELVQIPVTDAPASSAEAALDSMPAAVPAPEAILVPKPVSVPAPVSASAPAPVAAPVSMPVVAAVPAEVNHLLEEKMSELEVLGFMQTDLNKQILRQNNYDLEQSVVDLCGFNEWDPLDGFSELVSMDNMFTSYFDTSAETFSTWPV